MCTSSDINLCVQIIIQGGGEGSDASEQFDEIPAKVLAVHDDDAKEGGGLYYTICYHNNTTPIEVQTTPGRLRVPSSSSTPTSSSPPPPPAPSPATKIGGAGGGGGGGGGAKREGDPTTLEELNELLKIASVCTFYKCVCVMCGYTITGACVRLGLA